MTRPLPPLNATPEYIAHALEYIMATQAEIEATLARVESSLANARTAITHQVEQLRAAVEAASDDLTPEQLSRFEAVASSLDDATAELGADDEPAPPPNP